MAQPPGQQARNRGIVRGVHLDAFSEEGAKRAAALREAEESLQRIGQLMPAALDAGLSLAEISRATGVSRPTLYELRTRYVDRQDLGLVFMQSVALAGSLPLRDLAIRIDVPEEDLLKLATKYQDHGQVDLEPGEDEGGTFPVAVITPRGIDALEAWFEHRNEEGLEP